MCRLCQPVGAIFSAWCLLSLFGPKKLSVLHFRSLQLCQAAGCLTNEKDGWEDDESEGFPNKSLSADRTHLQKRQRQMSQFLQCVRCHSATVRNERQNDFLMPSWHRLECQKNCSFSIMAPPGFQYNEEKPKFKLSSSNLDSHD